MADSIKLYKFDEVHILIDGNWHDYATVKDASDVDGVNRLAYRREGFRIQRYEDRSKVAITKDTFFEFAGKLHEWH